MKKFVINVDYSGQMGPFTIYIGQCDNDHHPIHFQADYLQRQKNGNVPAEIMDALSDLKEISDKNGVLLEELCVYAIGTKENSDTDEDDLINIDNNNEKEEIFNIKDDE